MCSFSGSGALRANSLGAQGSDIYITHSAPKPRGVRGQEMLEHIKKSGKSKLQCFSSQLMKRVFNFMRNPKLAHILVCSYSHPHVHSCYITAGYSEASQNHRTRKGFYISCAIKNWWIFLFFTHATYTRYEWNQTLNLIL